MAAKRLIRQRKRMASNLYLPDDCWEVVLSFLDVNNGDYIRCLQTLSLVSKQFLSMTNRFKFSFTMCDPTVPRVFYRFPNLISIDLTCFRGDLDSLLCRISSSGSPLLLRSLNLSNQPFFPSIGLQAFAKKAKTNLISLTCSNIGFLSRNSMRHVANCFPFLEELDLSFPKAIDQYDSSSSSDDDDVKLMSLKLHNLRKVNLSGYIYGIQDSWLFHLCNNCELLEEVVMLDCPFITYDGIASAIRKRPSLRSFSVTNFGKYGEGRFIQHLDLQSAKFLNDLRLSKLSLLLGNLVSINISGCEMLTESGLAALIRNCRLLNEIRMERTGFGEAGELDPNELMDFVVNPHHKLKSLHLACNSSLTDECIIVFASVCPNLQLLDLSSCYGISEAIGEVLRRFSEIRHLSLAFCSGVKIHEMNFEAPKLEVLNLSYMEIDDEALYVISKSCHGLLQLELKHCFGVTEKGVKMVIENCTQLREINLELCYNVEPNVVTWMVFLRPSLRRIKSPPHFHLSDYERRLFLRHGCLVS